MKKMRVKVIGAILIALAILVAGFQNCSQFKSSPQSSSNGSERLANNGEGYSGKGYLFRRYDNQMACSDYDRNGKPLPNEQIFYQSNFPNGTIEPYVVRENCTDITPRPIDSTDIKQEIGGLNFKGQNFENYQATADFQVLAAACPSGKTVVPGALRSNLIINSQNWTEQPVYQGWMWHSGILALLNGSIMSLPAYSLVRSDSAFPEEFRRISQYKQLKSNTDYAFSFLAKKGTREMINFRYYRVDQTTNEEYIIVDFNLSSGLGLIRKNTNLAQAKITMTPVGEGYFCTVYFTTSATGGESYSDFGISPTANNGITTVGDSVYATAAQLEATGGYCQ